MNSTVESRRSWLVDTADFDASLKVGLPVEVRWTVGGGYYRENGVVSKVNAKSVLVALDNEVMHDGMVGWRQGQNIKAPRFSLLNRLWSQNNGVFPRSS